jgi:hypothetical protein
MAMINLLLKLGGDLRARLNDGDREQGGAILLVVLAGILIVVLTGLAMYDAGTVAQEEMQLQTAADSAAFSQSVVKARSMNMISYANTAKRVLFSYFVVHMTGKNAMVSSTIIYIASCVSSYGTDTESCERAAVGLSQGAEAELPNLLNNVQEAGERAADEIETLDDFQAYLTGITPWWAYAENMMRGTQNGATITTAWPVPEGTLPNWANKFVGLVQAYDDNFDTNYSGAIPDKTDRFDRLPIQQRDVANDGYFDFHFGDGLDYCSELALSLEHILLAAEHIISSDGNDDDGISTDGQTMGLFALGTLLPIADCREAFDYFQVMIKGGSLGDMDFAQKVMDYRVDEGGFEPDALDENEWMQRTSNITLAYRDAQRSSGLRDKYSGIFGDHDESPLYQSDGTWSVARSEVVFGEPAEENIFSDIPLIGNVAGSLINGSSDALAGPVVYMRGNPHMWSPRWTARLRPVYLPGEHLGTTLSGEDVGLGAVFIDTLPYLAASKSMATVVDDDFDVTTAVADMYFMYAASSAYTLDRMEGFEQ